MCGRITRTSPREAIAKEFGVTRFAEVDWHPHYNVAPSQIVETIISVNGERRLGPMRWGFVSPTATEPKLAPINVRAETSWSGAFRVGCATATSRLKACCDDGERLVTSSGARWFTHARLRSRAFRNRTLRGACSICRNLGEVNDELGAALRLGRLRNGRPRRLEPSSAGAADENANGIRRVCAGRQGENWVTRATFDVLGQALLLGEPAIHARRVAGSPASGSGARGSMQFRPTKTRRSTTLRNTPRLVTWWTTPTTVTDRRGSGRPFRSVLNPDSVDISPWTASARANGKVPREASQARRAAGFPTANVGAVLAISDRPDSTTFSGETLRAPASRRERTRGSPRRTIAQPPRTCVSQRAARRFSSSWRADTRDSRRSRRRSVPGFPRTRVTACA